jgi:hypothetical protein
VHFTPAFNFPFTDRFCPFNDRPFYKHPGRSRFVATKQITMKKIFLLSTAVVLMASVYANTDVTPIGNKKKEVSYQTREAFYQDFGNVPVSEWKRTSNYDEVTFTSDGQPMTAYYDYNSELIGTTQDKTFQDLPAKAQKFIHKKYDGYTTDAVVYFDDNEINTTDMMLYGTAFNDEDNYFVELTKDNKTIVLQVTMNGEVEMFQQL